MASHPFDEAIRLLARADGSFDGHTSAAYANMVGPFGGITTAQALQAVLQHPDRLGEPIALTVNFCAPVADGPFQVVAQPVRTNRSTQHWVIDLRQQEQTVMSGTAVTALRRETWGVDEEPMPICPSPHQVAVPETPAPMEFVKRYEQRFVKGSLPLLWDGQESSSLTQLWVRDMPPRPLDFASLSAIADIFLPRVFVRRSTHVPVGTVSMTVYFHASSAQLEQTGTGYLLGQAKAQAFRNGFFDQTSQLWNEAGALLVTTHQIVYFRQ